MKKLVLVLLLCFSLVFVVGCDNVTPPVDESGSLDIEPSVESIENSTVEESNEDDLDDWGVWEELVTRKDDKYAWIYIKFPTLSGINRGSGKIAYQTDKTLVLLDAERETGSPELENDSCDNIFPAYFEQAETMMKHYRQYNYSDFHFTIDTKEIVTVNGYEMCRYTGTHTFLFEDLSKHPSNTTLKSMNFVAYTTRLKRNNAVVYWMVIDESDDQSLRDTIKYYADTMAKTLVEEETCW